MLSTTAFFKSTPNDEICRVKTRKIVITGGPGTGKTSIIRSLEESGHNCLHEISRQITLEAQEQGVQQLFLTEPLLFSERLLEGRIRQYKEAEFTEADPVFIDRGIPDVVAYMDYFGNEYPCLFEKACEDYRYDQVFILPPWKEIYISDNERYENFEQAVLIYRHLIETYRRTGYMPLEVPIGPIAERRDFIVDNLS